jgi:hypothetical protein
MQQKEKISTKTVPKVNHAGGVPFNPLIWASISHIKCQKIVIIISP